MYQFDRRLDRVVRRPKSPLAMHSALLLVLSLVLLVPSVQAADVVDLKQECQKVVDQDTTDADFSALIQICREILAKNTPEPEQREPVCVPSV
jgi:hypothetical protein